MKFYFILNFLLLSSCTITFQNVCTSGKASDVIDDELSSQADIQADALLEGV